MTRLAFAVLLFPLAAFGGVEEELAAAAQSPYDIARFVDSHVTFDWAPLWKALGIKGQMFTHACGTDGGPKRDCNEELITVLDPFQVIVRIYHDIPFTDTYVRFLRPSGQNGSGPWRFAGVHEGIQKYYLPRHRIIRIGKRPFLLATEQGVSGSDWASEIENWFDLTEPDLEPVFCLTVKGSYSGMPDRVGYQTSATVVGLESDPEEQIHVIYHARFDAHGPLSQRSDDVVYTRRGKDFVFDASASKASKPDLDKIYEILEGPSDDDFLRYLLPDLKKIAAGPKNEQRDWLVRFLRQCSNTPEKRALNELLTAPAKPK